MHPVQPVRILLLLAAVVAEAQAFGQSRIPADLVPAEIGSAQKQIQSSGHPTSRINHRIELGLYGGGPQTSQTPEWVNEDEGRADFNRNQSAGRISGLFDKNSARKREGGHQTDEAREDHDHQHNNHHHGQQDNADHDHDDHLVPHHFQLEQIRALHESAKRLEGVGMPDLAHELHRRADQIEREIDRAQKPQPQQILMELMENMQLLRREVREVNERLDQVMNRIEHKAPPKRRDNDSQSEILFPKARPDSDLRKTDKPRDRD